MMVTGTLLLIGFRAVTDVTQTGCEAIASSFEQDMFSLFSANRNPGSLQRAELNAPCDATAVCFGDNTSSTIPGVRAASSVDSPTNIYLIRNQLVVDTYQYEHFSDTHSPQCISASGGNFRIIVEGFNGAKIGVNPQ